MAGAAFAALQGVGCTPWRPLVSVAFCVAGAALAALQGVGCTTWRPLVSAALPVTFAWAGTALAALQGGRMYALASLGLRRFAGRFCVAGAALGALQGVGCTPWRPLVSAAFCMAGAALAALQGVGCTPWRPLGLRRSAGRFCVAGAALAALQGVGCTPWRPGLRRSAGGFCMASAALGALQGVGCTPWRPLVSVAFFAWQAQHLLLCKGSDVRPGVPWSPLLFAWAGAALAALQGVGCTTWRPLVSAALPVTFAWRAQHLLLCKGSDVRLASLGLRRSAGSFCVAGAALAALQGVGCTPWRPLVSGGFCVASAALAAL